MIGERLILLRGSKTQQEVADALGISRARYSHYENGRNEPDLAILAHLADYFQVTADFLIGRAEKVREEKADYVMLRQAQELLDLFAKDSDSYRFWLEYKKASPEKQKNFIRMWNVLSELDKKKK